MISASLTTDCIQKNPFAYDEVASGAQYLDTPRLIKDTLNRTVWTWDSTDPYGNNAPNENPSGLGIFTYNLRHPGQVSEKETGTFYNYFRDCFDPRTGRYCQSDPSGLDGGTNTYLYTGGNPISRVDPTGQNWATFIVPIVTIGGGLYCYTKGIEKCEKMYPNHKDREHPDFAKFIQCSTGVAHVISLGIGISSDPIGGAATAAGEAIEKKLCNDCQ